MHSPNDLRDELSLISELLPQASTVKLLGKHRPRI